MLQEKTAEQASLVIWSDSIFLRKFDGEKFMPMAVKAPLKVSSDKRCILQRILAGWTI